jgi:hypothetical protein
VFRVPWTSRDPDDDDVDPVIDKLPVTFNEPAFARVVTTAVSERTTGRFSVPAGMQAESP